MSVLYDLLADYELDYDEQIDQVPQEQRTRPSPSSSILKALNTTTASLSHRTSKPVFIFKESFKHNLICSQRDKNLSLVSNLSNFSKSEKSIDELNTIDLHLLNKKQKKQVKSKFHKNNYYVDFSRADFSIKSTHFGANWHEAYKEMVQSDWDRIKFLAKPYQSSSQI